MQHPVQTNTNLEKDPLDIEESKCETKIEHVNISDYHIIKTVPEGQKNHKCVLCNKTFIQLKYLKSHINSVHEGLKNHKCELCDKAYNRLEHLKNHINSVHERKKNHKCDICDKAFNRQEHLKRHFISFHEKEKKT